MMEYMDVDAEILDVEPLWKGLFYINVICLASMSSVPCI